MDKISVIIPAFNAADFIADTIQSACNMTHAPHEIIVIDDGSDDDTAKIVGQMAGITLLQQANAGDAAARNAGLKACSGDYVIFLDHDDLLLPDAAHHHLDWINDTDGYDMVFGSNFLIDAAGQQIGENRQQPARFSGRDVALGVTPSFSQCLYRRCALERIGGFRKEAGACADHDLNMRLLWGAKRGFVHGEMVMKYRLHENQQTKSPANMYRQHMQVLERLLGDDGECADAELLLEARRHWQQYYGKFLPSEIARMVLHGKARQAWSALRLYGSIAPRAVPSTMRYWAGLKR